MDWPADISLDGVPVVTGVVIETLEGRAAALEPRLEKVDGLRVVGGDGARRIAAVWAGESGRSLLKAVESFVHGNDEVLGVYPTFIGQDEPHEPSADD